MKKLFSLLTILLCIGCAPLNNNPISKVEDYLAKYQTLDESVIQKINDSIDSNYNQSQVDEYKKLMKEQYKSLTYEIKDDYIDGNKALVEVEIKVKDYYKAIEEANKKYSSYDENYLDTFDEYINYRLRKMKEVKDTVIYRVNISLTKNDENWSVDSPNFETLDKINGIHPH